MRFFDIRNYFCLTFTNLGDSEATSPFRCRVLDY